MEYLFITACLLTFNEGENLTECYEFNVFDSNGILLFNVSFPNVHVDKFSIYGDRIYLVDSQNESCVYEYRIVEIDSLKTNRVIF